jgi:hypothetical protein
VCVGHCLSTLKGNLSVPFSRAKQAKNIPEERRLLYISIEAASHAIIETCIGHVRVPGSSFNRVRVYVTRYFFLRYHKSSSSLGATALREPWPPVLFFLIRRYM